MKGWNITKLCSMKFKVGRKINKKKKGQRVHKFIVIYGIMLKYTQLEAT